MDTEPNRGGWRAVARQRLFGFGSRVSRIWRAPLYPHAADPPFRESSANPTSMNFVEQDSNEDQAEPDPVFRTRLLR
ncbi:hypothetical protein [Leifsonia aquatica]|uniref:hypothetical protein n=1 Tax=Leifsonia aquatica TaxID=144185 RepID=UPI0013B3A8DA|nr:hypothetical protein [Leifsonia aquatica]